MASLVDLRLGQPHTAQMGGSLASDIMLLGDLLPGLLLGR